MKKLILSLAVAAVLVPAVAFADHLQGTFGSFGKDHITVTDPVHKKEVRFTHGGTVPFVDEHGAVVEHSTLKAGHPVTVEYTGTGEHRKASRVVVHKQTTTTTTHGH